MADNVNVLPAGTTPIAADDVSSVWYQRIKLQVGADGSATDFLHKSSRADTYTVAGSGTTVDVSAQAMDKFSVQVKGTGATPTAWSVVLEISLNNSQFTTILTHNNVDGQADGETMTSFANRYPALYFRSRLVSVTLGSATNVVVTICGK